ncbi:MAG TPA: VWA domain-containing protein [Candidatus Sulfotelmatobacter sp.]|nr:VWA domain-containing protein [Candidatus Sulfotelmatobacter sp.]
MNRLSAPLAGFLLLAPALLAQGPTQQSTQDQTPTTTVRTSAQEVLLDMVFRDKKGKAVRDVRPEEIHVFEDGVEQKLTSFRLLEGTSAHDLSPTAPASGPLRLDPMREIRLVTLVFQGLDVDGKRFFRQAVKDILDTSPEQNLYYSILTIDQKLHCIQPFTQDHAELLKSLDKSSMWSFVQYSNQSASIKESLQQTVAQGEPSLSSASGPGGGGPSSSQIQGAVTWRMAKLQYDMLQQADAADREYHARADLDALMALVMAQSQLPGRKVVLYFNPALSIPEAVKEQYANLISMANRSNVTFYTVDPKGLVALGSATDRKTNGAWSEGSEGRTQLNDALSEVRNQQLKGGVGEVSTAQARASENAETALRSNPLLWLRDLSQQTGGTTIAETNDLRAPLRVAMDEVRSYYESAYNPHISVFDGKFRKITVRVDRPDVIVHTRSGYFALPQLKGGQQMYAYELPLLNALDATPGPTDVTFQAAAERFNDHGPKVEYMVTLEAPLKEMAFSPQPDKKTAAVDAAILAVFKDSHGEIVEKFSKDFAVQVDLDKVDAYKAGNLLQTFRTELAPGTYTFEAALMDRNGNKIGVKKTTVTVPASSDKLSISNVVVIRRTDPLKDNQILDAFYFPGGKIVPTLSDRLKGGPGNVLPFYFSIYPDRAVADHPKLSMAFYKEGQYLGAAEAPLPDAQKDGRIPYIANLPADKFTPGAYEIRIGVAQGESKAEEKVDFRVE